MRKWKLALAAAVLVAPLGSLNADSNVMDAAIAPAPIAPQGTSLTDEGQGWGCCWIFWYGRWMCVPC